MAARRHQDQRDRHVRAGHAQDKLWRSGKGEWFGGTEGFYWGCNNAKDLEVARDRRRHGRPANLVFHPADRDKKWVELYRSNVGNMDETFAKTAFTTPPLCSSWSVDAKFTSYELAKDLLSIGTFGPPLGQTWSPRPRNPASSKRFARSRAIPGRSWREAHRRPRQPRQSTCTIRRATTS